MATFRIDEQEKRTIAYVIDADSESVGAIQFDADTDINKAEVDLLTLIDWADNPPVIPDPPKPLTTAEVQAILDGLPTGKRSKKK